MICANCSTVQTLANAESVCPAIDARTRQFFERQPQNLPHFWVREAPALNGILVREKQVDVNVWQQVN